MDDTTFPDELDLHDFEHEDAAAEDEAAARECAVLLLTYARARLGALPEAGNLLELRYAREAEDYLRGAARLLPDHAAELRGWADQLRAAVMVSSGAPLTTSILLEQVEVEVAVLLAWLKQESGS